MYFVFCIKILNTRYEILNTKMLTIVHGDDTAQSRKYFLAEKERYRDAISLEAEKITFTDLKQIFEGGGLFTESKTVFIEQLLTKKKKIGNIETILSYLQEQAETHAVYLWEGKELEKSTLNPFKKALIKPYKLPQSLFLFLDNLKPGNTKVLLSLFHKTIINVEEEMVFFMLVRHVRMLLGLLEPSADEIDELKRASWQKPKLTQQARSFGKEKLLQIYADLYGIEKAQKVGLLPTNLTNSIDFLLFKI